MQFFQRITSTPKKRAMTLVGLGCLATLSLPPFFLLPLLFVSTCGWLSLLLRTETKGQAFRTGWWWGVGFFISGLYWICNSLLVDAERFAWMIPFALLGLNSLIAIFPGLASLVFFCVFKKLNITNANLGTRNESVDESASRQMQAINIKEAPFQGDSASAEAKQKSPHSSLSAKGEGVFVAVFLFTLCFSLSEFARSHVLTGFPWNLVGYAWGDWLSGMQIASLVGIHGLTLLTILFSLIPLLYKHGEKQVATKILMMWMLLLAWGMWRVDYTPAPQLDDQPVVRVVQAAIPQTLKWDPKARIQGVRKHMDLTLNAEGDADVIVWSESSVPFAINRETLLLRDLQAMLAPGQMLITGALRLGEPSGDKPVLYNSVYAIDQSGVLQTYDKHHLVPFGEFVPLRGVLPVSKISPGDLDYSRGPGPKTIGPLAGIPPFSPLVCYEAIFAEEVVGDGQPRPEWLVNVTNDAWFGDSTGPYQHLHMTRFRAVEQGLPLVRVANTGISAVIDGVGRVVDHIPLNQSGTMDVALPKPLAATPYSLLGNWGYGGLLVLLLAITLGCVQHRLLKS